MEEVTTLFRPAIFFPSAGPFGFFPRLHFHDGPSWPAGCGHGSTTHPATGAARPWASCPSVGRLIGGKQPSNLLQNRKLLSQLPEGQELSPWQPWDKEATLTLPRAVWLRTLSYQPLVRVVQYRRQEGSSSMICSKSYTFLGKGRAGIYTHCRNDNIEVNSEGKGLASHTVSQVQQSTRVGSEFSLSPLKSRLSATCVCRASGLTFQPQFLYL